MFSFYPFPRLNLLHLPSLPSYHPLFSLYVCSPFFFLVLYVFSFFSLLSVFWKNKSQLMRSCCCLSVFMSIFPISSWLRRYFHQWFFYYYPFSFLCSPPLPILPPTPSLPPSSSVTCSFRVSFSLAWLPRLWTPCRFATRHISVKKLHPIICPPLIHNKQALASDVRRWTAMTWSIVGMPPHKRLWGWTTHDLPGHKESPTGGQVDCAQGRGPPDTDREREGAMYCRYRYNAKYVAVSSALFPKPRVVSCSFPFGSTRKSKWTQSNRHFKLDQDHLYTLC
jgi:hypothetical protein